MPEAPAAPATGAFPAVGVAAVPAAEPAVIEPGVPAAGTAPRPEVETLEVPALGAVAPAVELVPADGVDPAVGEGDPVVPLVPIVPIGGDSASLEHAVKESESNPATITGCACDMLQKLQSLVPTMVRSAAVDSTLDNLG